MTEPPRRRWFQFSPSKVIVSSLLVCLFSYLNIRQSYWTGGKVATLPHEVLYDNNFYGRGWPFAYQWYKGNLVSEDQLRETYLPLKMKGSWIDFRKEALKGMNDANYDTYGGSYHVIDLPGTGVLMMHRINDEVSYLNGAFDFGIALAVILAATALAEWLAQRRKRVPRE